ncbi:MAG: hypothetical protein HC869_21315 [Rhodospirillales bacterium]|nr:hypothetical protein [Rhodospirillales bacterium]
MKAINQAYQRLKHLERKAKQRPAAAGAHHRARAAFAIFFLLPVVTAALLLAAQNNLAHPDPATHENAAREATPAAASVEDDKHLSPTAPQSMSYVNADPPSAEEPSVAAVDRLR